MIRIDKINESVFHSSFEAKDRNNEHFILIAPQENISFEETLKDIYSQYISALNKNGLSDRTIVFCRFFLSDVANQKDILFASSIFKSAKAGAYSIVEQCPLHGGKAAFLCHHLKNTKLKKETTSLDKQNWRNSAIITGAHYNLLYAMNFSETYPFNSETQTNEIFLSYNSFLKKQNCSLLGNALRAWVFVRDIDNHYQGMVKARKEFFRNEGLSPETRFIASTGIEGKSKETSTLVSLDALAISNLDPRQIIRIEAREHLNPTHEYGVTFERGTRVDFGDRSHLYISGTASIDKYGHTLYPHDIEKQTERMIENVEALLKSQKSKMEDFVYLIVYLRNPTDAKTVRDILRTKGLDRLPLLMVEGAVCRPEWLVEMEGVAIVPSLHTWPLFI